MEDREKLGTDNESTIVEMVRMLLHLGLERISEGSLRESGDVYAGWDGMQREWMGAVT